MRPKPLRLLLPVLLASAAFGDRVVSTFGFSTQDSSMVRKVYGARAFANDASTTSLVASDGALILDATLRPDSGAVRSARAGLRIPAHLLGPTADLRRATAIRLRIKGSGTFDALLQLESQAYAANPGGQAEVAPLHVTPDWQEITLPLTADGFRFPCAAAADWCDPTTFPARLRFDSTQADYADPDRNAARAVEALRVSLVPTWSSDSTGSRPEPGAARLWLDDLVILGMPQHPEVHGQGCRKDGPSVVFSTNKEETNQAGGYWYVFTDTGAVGLAKGTSTVILPTGARKWKVDTAQAVVTLIADLSRSSSQTAAGFAAAGTNTTDDWRKKLDLTGLTSIGFSLSVPEGATLDPATVGGVNLEIGTASADPSGWKTHSVMIPASQFATGTTEICIDVDMFRMPKWSTSTSEYEPPSLEAAHTLNWVLRIQDPTGSDIAVPHQGFSLGPILFYGIASFPEPQCIRLQVDEESCRKYNVCDPYCADPYSLATSAQPTTRPTATYRDGLLSLRGYETYRTLDILSLQGRRLASLPPSPLVKFRLERGAYLLVARAPGRPPLVRPLAVAK